MIRSLTLVNENFEKFRWNEYVEKAFDTKESKHVVISWQVQGYNLNGKYKIEISIQTVEKTVYVKISNLKNGDATNVLAVTEGDLKYEVAHKMARDIAFKVREAEEIKDMKIIDLFNAAATQEIVPQEPDPSEEARTCP